MTAKVERWLHARTFNEVAKESASAATDVESGASLQVALVKLTDRKIMRKLVFALRTAAGAGEPLIGMPLPALSLPALTGPASFLGGMVSMVFICSTLSGVRLTQIENERFVLPAARVIRSASGEAWNTSAPFQERSPGAC